MECKKRLENLLNKTIYKGFALDALYTLCIHCLMLGLKKC